MCVYATFGGEIVDWKTLQVVLRLSWLSIVVISDSG